MRRNRISFAWSCCTPTQVQAGQIYVTALCSRFLDDLERGDRRSPYSDSCFYLIGIIRAAIDILRCLMCFVVVGHGWPFRKDFLQAKTPALLKMSFGVMRNIVRERSPLSSTRDSCRVGGGSQSLDSGLHVVTRKPRRVHFGPAFIDGRVPAAMAKGLR